MSAARDETKSVDRALSIVREGELRKRLLARDEQALVELVDLATPWLLGLTQGILSDKDEAEDVVMETFHTIWQKIDSLQDRGDGLMPWLMSVARNRAIDRIRARRRHSGLNAYASTIGVFGNSSVAPTEPNEAAQPGWHVHQTVQGAIAMLPEDQQVAIRLAYFQGLTQSEIAERLDIPLGTVKTRLRLAFDKLRLTLASVKDWIV